MAQMKRYQTFHETLIPLLVSGIGAQSYLEFGTEKNATISKVKCKHRYGVDTQPKRIDGIRWFEMTTTQFIGERAGIHGPFDVVFIDADHDADEVQKDFRGIWPHVSDDGLILCHDTNPETEDDTAPGLCGDSWEFAESLWHRGIEAATLPFHPGLTIVRKRNQWGPSLESVQ